ncbi:transcription antitermination factor NusB [Thermosulfuriphilus sp.]
MSARRRARETALQVLYEIEMTGSSPEEAFSSYVENFAIRPKAEDFARELVRGVLARKEEIDSTIKRHSRNWRLERMASIDRNILRIATYELLFRPDIPPKVSLNEAVELAKRFGSEDSAAFVNGILDAIYRQEIRSEEAAKAAKLP